jgi:hypothetical protein
MPIAGLSVTARRDGRKNDWRGASLAILFGFAFAGLGLWTTAKSEPAPPGQPAACAGGVTVLLNGAPLSSGCVLNIKAGSGIMATPSSNPSIAGTDLSFAYNPALLPTHDTIHANENWCDSTNGTLRYTCSLPNKTLANGYNVGMELLLRVDATCAPTCTVNVDGDGDVTITQFDGVSPPNGALVAGQAKRVWYDGTVFRIE